MAKEKAYKVFVSSSGEGDPCILVKEGWSWPAFFLTWLWAFWVGCYKIGFVLLPTWWFLSRIEFWFLGFVSDIILGWEHIEYWLRPEVIIFNIIGIGIRVYCGLQANEWQEDNLLSRNYEYVTSITGINSKTALEEYSRSLNEPPNE